MDSFDQKALWKITYGIYLIGSHNGDRINAQIVNTVVQVAAKPARIAVSINKDCFTHSMIEKSREFSASVLEQDAPMEFIGLFGFKSGRDINKFEKISHEAGLTKCPVVTAHSLAVMEARVISTADVGTHTIFIADVISGRVLKDGVPLTYAYYQDVKKGRAHKNAPTFKGATENSTKAREEVMVKYVCKICGYIYDPKNGDPDNGVAAGTKFEDLPDDWVCPICGVGKDQFELKQ